MLEQEFVEMLGMKYVFVVFFCLVVLFLLLKVFGLFKNVWVLISGFMFVVVLLLVVYVDYQLVFCEVGENYCIDIVDFKVKLGDVDVVIISYMWGYIFDMDVIMVFCDVKGILVIEDVVYLLGIIWNGQNIGMIGKVGCFFFQFYKLINVGEGGILVIDDVDLVVCVVIMFGVYEYNW